MAKYNGETVFSILNWWFSYLKGVYRGYSAPILQIANKHRVSTFLLLHSSHLKARNSIRCFHFTCRNLSLVTVLPEVI
jgi:hypothetical protein